jgi:hypothetical protein
MTTPTDLTEQYPDNKYAKRVAHFLNHPMEDSGNNVWIYQLEDQADIDLIIKIIEKHNKHTPKWGIKMKKIVFHENKLYVYITSHGGLVFTNRVFLKYLKPEKFKKPKIEDPSYRWKSGELALPPFEELLKGKDQLKTKDKLHFTGASKEPSMIALQGNFADFDKEDFASIAEKLGGKIVSDGKNFYIQKE